MCTTSRNEHALYAILSTRDPWIRLLQLQPASDKWDKITCILEEHPLLFSLRYKALSYAWNQNILSKKSEIDDMPSGQNQITLHATHKEESTEHKVTITQSLSLALRRLRTTNQPLTLWVDSLCINQQDDDERTSQVGLMAMIYRFAEEVIIWLGEKDAEDDLGESLRETHSSTIAESDWSEHNTAQSLVDRYIGDYETLSETSSGFMTHKRDVYGAFCLIWSLSQGISLTNIPFYHTNTFTNRFHMGWMIRVSEGLRAILERNWWRRAWVVQETILARKATIVYSTLTAPWSMFADAARLHLQQQVAQDFDQHLYFSILESSRSDDALDELCRVVLSIECTRREWVLQQPVQLLTLLRRFRSRLATDRRDKVFSLLGLVNQWMQASLEITYSMDTKEVYMLTALHAIKETQSLSVLCDAKSVDQLQNVDAAHTRNEIPLSWVPDWSKTLADGGLDLERMLRFENYSAGTSPGHACIHADSILETGGIIIGTIKAVAPVVPQDAIEQLRRTISGWEHWWFHNTAGPRYSTSIFWETVCGGCLYQPNDANPRQPAYSRASLEQIQKASRAWNTDTTTKRNRKTAILDDSFANSYIEPKEVTQLKNAFYYSVRPATVSRCFFTFTRGSKKSFDISSKYSRPDRDHIGVGPSNLRIGDVIYIPHGSKVPLIIRPSSGLKQQLYDKFKSREGEPHEMRRLIGPKENAISQCTERHELHTLVGDAYVNGCMYAEDSVSNAAESVKIFLR